MNLAVNARDAMPSGGHAHDRDAKASELDAGNAGRIAMPRRAATSR